MGSGPDIAGRRSRRYFSCEQVHKRFRATRAAACKRSIGPEIRGAFREEAPRVIQLPFSVLSCQNGGRIGAVPETEKRRTELLTSLYFLKYVNTFSIS